MSAPSREEEQPRAAAAKAPLDIRVGSATNALQPISSAERRVGAGAVQWVSLALVAAAAAAADQVTKWTVAGALGLGDRIRIVGPFSIEHVRNSGIAFGLFSSATSAVVVLTAVAVGCMLFFFARSGQRHPMLPVALGFVLGGSLSNLVDRVRLGYVTDFLHLPHWPQFNLADTFIVVGVALLFAALLATDRTRTKVGTAPLSRL